MKYRMNSEAPAPLPAGGFDASTAKRQGIGSAAQGKEDCLVSERGRFREFKERHAGQSTWSAGQLTGDEMGRGEE